MPEYGEALDRFGAVLIKRVRDSTIEDWKQIIDGRMGGEIADATRDLLSQFGGSTHEDVHKLIPSIVDGTLHNLMVLLEELKDVEILMGTSDGRMVNLRSASNEAGEGLIGDLYSWISQFATQPSWNHPERGDGRSLAAPPVQLG